MNAHPSFRMLALSACIATLAACNAGQPTTTPAQTAGTSSPQHSSIDNAIDNAIARAGAKLRSKNLTISNSFHTTGQPKAEITPQGDLLVEGKPVALNPAQRQEVLAYRQQLIEIGEQGIAIGKQGAKLGLDTAATALAGVMSGKSEQQVRAKAEAQASGIRQAAVKICNRLPALLASQKKLAAEVPAFKPYATMTQKDIDDCRTNALKDSK